ncbi:MAG: hypothetical protein AAF235_12000, partial [Planctomycetota bacterium]
MRLILTCAAAAMLGACAKSAFAQAVNYRVAALSGEALADAGTDVELFAFGTPWINDMGTVALSARLAGDGVD